MHRISLRSKAQQKVKIEAGQVHFLDPSGGVQAVESQQDPPMKRRRNTPRRPVSKSSASPLLRKERIVLYNKENPRVFN